MTTTNIPIAVAVIGCGRVHDAIVEPWVTTVFVEDRIIFTNLRKALPEQSQDRVLHGQDGSDSKTMHAVYAQPAFASTIVKTLDDALMKAMVDGSRGGFFVVGKCNTAAHRADVTRRTLRDVFNSIEVGGLRVFNAQMFSLHEVKHDDEQVHVLESASRWIDAPWCMVDKPLSYDRYAKSAVGLREEAQVNFDAIWTHVDVVV